MARPSRLVAGERFPDSRAAPRYPLIAPAEITEPLSKRSIAGSIAVISLTGCYFRAAKAPSAGTVVRLRIER
ncbi:MAG TPA: PilZ domain-containing protein, partial [Phototrophicaceae bacterium]|nr:PilZ domain-containing protein [Phototrophicaceae bacterium]